jgi:hypothetical protein
VTDVTATIDDYFAMWNEPDAELRAALIARAWAPDGRYRDPALEADGHAELSDMVESVQARFPGHRFRRLSAVDSHHDEARFAWQLADEDGQVAVAGIDVAGFDGDGRIKRISGFFGELEGAAE